MTAHDRPDAPHKLTPGGFIRERQLRPSIIPIAHSSLWRMVKDGRFPRPVKLSERVTAWKTDDVIAWVAEQGDDK